MKGKRMKEKHERKENTDKKKSVENATNKQTKLNFVKVSQN